MLVFKVLCINGQETKYIIYQALATRKIVTRLDASIEKINKIWAVHFRP